VVRQLRQRDRLQKPNVTSYQDTGLSPGRRYTYRVRAHNNADSEHSKEVSAKTPAPPAAPGALTAKAVSCTQIDLKWSDKSDNETGFKIERKDAESGDWKEKKPNVTSYQDTGLSPGRRYTYRVRAHNNADSEHSKEVSDKTPKYIKVSITRLDGREGKVSDKESEIVWLDQEWTEGSATLVCKLASGAAEKWLLLDFPLNAKQKLGLRVFKSPEGGLSVTQGSGTSAQTLVEGIVKRRNDGKTVLLECNPDRKAWANEELRHMIQSMVLELHAKNAGKTARFVLRPKKPQRCAAKFGWVGDKQPTLLKSWHADIEYPWPGLLHGRPGERNGDKGGFKPVSVKIGKKKFNLEPAVHQQEKKARVILSAAEIDERLKEWEAGLADQKRKLEEAKKKEKNLNEKLSKAKGQQGNQIHGDLKKATEAQRKAEIEIQKRITQIGTMSTKLEKLGPIVIYDPWDLPVAEVTIKLVPPQPAGDTGGGK